MTLKKRLLRAPCLITLLSYLIAFYMKIVIKTTRWTTFGEDIMPKYWHTKKPFIVCFWHNRLFLQTQFWQDSSPFFMLISDHQDGLLISKTVGHFGIKTIQGSSSKGGIQAFRAIQVALKAGYSIGITPDGPRGPRFNASEGVVQIARRAQVDIVPCAYATNRRKVWSSWDRFLLPLPFSRGALVVGSPIAPPTSKEQCADVRQQIEQGLLHVCDQADRWCGHPPLR